MVAPPLKGAVSLGERAIFQIGKSAMARASERQMLLTTEKTIAAATERKIVQRSTSNMGEVIVKEQTIGERSPQARLAPGALQANA